MEREEAIKIQSEYQSVDYLIVPLSAGIIIILELFGNHKFNNESDFIPRKVIFCNFVLILYRFSVCMEFSMRIFPGQAILCDVSIQ
jgi:hypothetical protein